MPRSVIRAMGLIKRAAARVNHSLGLLERNPADAIKRAATEVVDGKLDAEFPVDIFQTGSGTSTNMNTNEVISNRATELLGGLRGSKLVHPNDHVNLGQSSNDVIPTAIHIAPSETIKAQLIPALTRLHKALTRKAREFDKSSRSAARICRMPHRSGWARSSAATPAKSNWPSNGRETHKRP